MTEKHLSTRFDSELSGISARVLEMGGLVESQAVQAMVALTQLSAETAAQVIEQEERVNRMEVEIDLELQRIIAMRQPAATDLRLLIAVSKASANLEMAHKIIALEKLNDQERDISVNVGLIQGGIGPNTVSDHASAEIDTRFLRQSDAEETAERMARITSQCTIAGTAAELQYVGGRPPMEQNSRNSRLFQLIHVEAEKLGLPCVEELRSGVSDANTIAQIGIPVVDGMGPTGDCDHSDREYMIRQSLPARSRLAACSILAGWEHLHP